MDEGRFRLSSLIPRPSLKTGGFMSKKVLIVDDASYMRELIKDILSKYGYEVVGEAEDGGDAVNKYSSLKPDLVTMDIVMKEKTGIDTVKEIMKNNPDAKILMISAMGQQAMVVEAIQAGAKGFVMKPFKPEVLLEEVKRIVGSRDEGRGTRDEGRGMRDDSSIVLRPSSFVPR